MHSHANDLAIAMNCVMEYGLSHRDKALHIAPLYHVGGMQAYFIPHLMVGGTNVVLGRYEAREDARADPGRARSPRSSPCRPRSRRCCSTRASATTTSPRPRMITTGGAAIAATTMERVIAEFCPNIYNGYGMTEASLTLLLHPEDALKQARLLRQADADHQCRIIVNDPIARRPPPPRPWRLARSAS